jgi:hypothetical protein
MEARRRTLVILGSAALVFALAAGVVLWQRAAEGLSRYTPVTFLPGFTEKAQDAARIEVTSHDGRFVVALTPEGWVLPERGNYPADFNEVRQTLITLAQLTTIAPKTSRADWLHHLSLDDPPKGTGTDLVVKDAGGAVLAELVFGNVEELGGTAGTAIFVRHPRDNQSYLAKAIFPLHGAVANWISRSVFDMGPGRLQEVVVTPPNGPGYTVGRRFAADMVSVLKPQGGTPDPQIINELGFAVAAFAVTDVKPATAVNFAGATQVSAHGFDGLAITLTVAQQGGEYWAQVSAAAAPGAKETVAQEAETMNARAKGWAFKVPPERGALMMTSLQRLMTPPAPKQGQISMPGAAPPPGGQ